MLLVQEKLLKTVKIKLISNINEKDNLNKLFSPYIPLCKIW